MARKISPVPTPSDVYFIDTARRALPLATLFTAAGLQKLTLAHNGQLRRSTAGYMPYYHLSLQATHAPGTDDRYWMTPVDTALLLSALSQLDRDDPAIDERIRQFESAHATLTTLTIAQTGRLRDLNLRLPAAWPAGHSAVMSGDVVKALKLPARQLRLPSI